MRRVTSITLLRGTLDELRVIDSVCQAKIWFLDTMATIAYANDRVLTPGHYTIPRNTNINIMNIVKHNLITKSLSLPVMMFYRSNSSNYFVTSDAPSGKGSKTIYIYSIDETGTIRLRQAVSAELYEDDFIIVLSDSSVVIDRNIDRVELFSDGSKKEIIQSTSMTSLKKAIIIGNEYYRYSSGLYLWYIGSNDILYFLFNDIIHNPDTVLESLALNNSVVTLDRYFLLKHDNKLIKGKIVNNKMHIVMTK